MINVTLYFREGCWLCDKAEEMLNGLRVKYDINIKKISIDSDREIYDLYRFDIPVLEFADGSTLHGVIKKKDLISKLDDNIKQKNRAEECSG
ncbi:MAG: glutaredoxin family protein [Nitrospirota bacterium]